MSLLEPHNLPFAAALCVMVILAVIQMVGVADFLGDPDFDHDVDHGPEGAGAGLASILGLGRVPFTIWLGLLLTAFAGIGVSIQELATSLTGGPLDLWLASAFALVGALPVTSALVRPLGRILPHDETSAVERDELLGRRARITDGTARRGNPARARVHDRHGMMHHVMVEPHEDAGELRAGEEVLLVRREGDGFFASALEMRQLSPN